jgi:methyltransferase
MSVGVGELALGWPQALAGLVALQRLGELAYARRNDRRLRAAGGIEYGRRHYPVLIAVHAAWLAAIAGLIPAAAAPAWPWLGAYLVLQGLRVWTVASLGPYWTTRVIVVPGAPDVRRGPYRWLKHPNYLVVAGEIAVLPLVFGAWPIALVFTLANAAVLARRIRVEEQARAGAA